MLAGRSQRSTASLTVRDGASPWLVSAAVSHSKLPEIHSGYAFMPSHLLYVLAAGGRYFILVDHSQRSSLIKLARRYFLDPW